MNGDTRLRWIKSLGYTLGIFIVLSVYFFLRRWTYDFSVFNKVLGSTAVIVAGWTLLVGPLARRLVYFARFMATRRQMGMIALYVAIFHIVASLVQADRFVIPTWYLEEWIPVLFGVIATIIWVYMHTLSTNEKIVVLGADRWKKYLSIAGKVSFVAVFLHVAVMKYPGWIRWAQGEFRQSQDLLHPEYPPESLIIGGVALAIIIYRIITDYVIKRTN